MLPGQGSLNLSSNLKFEVTNSFIYIVKFSEGEFTISDKIHYSKRTIFAIDHSPSVSLIYLTLS